MVASAHPHAPAPVLAGWRRTRPARARVGVQVDERRLAVVRVRAGQGERPVLDHVETVASADAGVRAGALRRLVQAGLMRDAEVSLALSAGQYELHPVTAPAVPDEEMRDAVRWQLRGMLSYGPEEATVDFTRLPQPVDAAGAQAAGRPQLLAVAARLATVDASVRLLSDCGIQVAAVDVPEFAQRNLALLNAGQASEGCVAWLSFEADACLLTVQLDGELCFARRFQAQGASLLVVAAEGGDADSVTQYFIERVVVHAQRSLELFERQSGLPSVSRMWIAPHSCAAQLARTVAERTGIESRVFAVAQAFEPGASFANSPVASQPNPDWLIAAGVALRDADSSSRRGQSPLRAWFNRLLAGRATGARSRANAPSAAPAGAHAGS